MEIDEGAPFVARKETYIAAPVAAAWEALTDLESWPAWQPGISSLTLEGPLQVGAVFRWKAQGLTITSTVRELEPGRRIGWTGRSLGMRASHRWLFTSEADGSRVVTEESLAGWFARLLKLLDRSFLEKSLEASLQLLKERVEQRADAA